LLRLYLKYDVELLYCFDKEGVLEDVDDPNLLSKIFLKKIFNIKRRRKTSQRNSSQTGKCSEQ
jgi:hypothetical protein